MYKIIFEIIKQPLGLPINPIYEYIILLVLNEVAFKVAWDASPGGTWGSLIHWLVRIPTLIFIWFIIYSIIFIGKWVIVNWIFIIIITILLGVIFGLGKYFIQKNMVKNQK